MPITIEKITHQLAFEEECEAQAGLASESTFYIGARVYFQDQARESNWYKGRIVDVNYLDEESTFNIKDEFGIISQNLPITCLRDPNSSNKDVKFPPKPKLPASQDERKTDNFRTKIDKSFSPGSAVTYQMSGKSCEGVIQAKNASKETYAVSNKKTGNLESQSFYLSQLSIAQVKLPLAKPKRRTTLSTKHPHGVSPPPEDSLVKPFKCIAASSSDRRNDFTNLGHGNRNWWCTKWGQSTGWVVFDLEDDYYLNSILVLGAKQAKSSPQDCSVDYLNANGDLMYSCATKFTYEDNGESQSFEIKNDMPVRQVRVNIHSNWGAKFIGVNRISFFGKCAQESFEDKKNTQEEENEKLKIRKRRHFALKIEIGDRIDYQWDDTGKWWTGRILHINEDYTYLLKDDYGFVKDHIAPEQTRQTRKRRKPRRIKASRKTTMETINEYIPFMKPARFTQITS